LILQLSPFFAPFFGMFVNALVQNLRTTSQTQGGEDDLDALLAHFSAADKQKKAVQVLGEAAPPSPRVFATWTALPSQVRTPAPRPGAAPGLTP
jgi:hypothetical protein